MKVPYVSAIESSKDWDKEHIHSLIRLGGLKENLSTNDNIENAIREECLSLDEVNNHIPDSVIIRTFPYLENNSRLLETAYIISVNQAPYTIIHSLENLKTELLLTHKHYEESKAKTFHISFDENNEDLYFEIMRESTQNLVPVAALGRYYMRLGMETGKKPTLV